MASVAPAMESASIVLVGSFNPAILHPQWFAKQGLLRSSEADDAGIDMVVNPALTAVRFAWFTLQVVGDRFTVTTTDPAHYSALQEFVSGTFELLEFTPIVAMGLNSERHIRAPTGDIWSPLEDMLVPRDPWSTVLPGPPRPSGRPNLQTLSVAGVRPNSPAERLGVTVEPSHRFSGGVYVCTNEHFQFGDGCDAKEAMKLLRENWMDALGYSNDITNHLEALAT